MSELRALDELLADVAKQGQILTEFLNSNSYYQPTFTSAGTGSGFKDYPELPENVAKARLQLQDAAKAVSDLAAGPKAFVRQHSFSVSHIMEELNDERRWQHHS